MVQSNPILTPPPSSSYKHPLKVTLSVLSPGDEVPPDDNILTEQDEDIESNLLRPLGVDPESVDLIIKLYEGADFPQSDVSFATGLKRIDKLTRQDRDLCDPYARISFSGRSITSTVCKNTYDPEWNEKLHLPVMLPSMCDRLKLQIYDSDLGFVLNEDDLIGTHLLSMSAISRSGERGFPPTFGPAYVNIYGAPREFSLLTSDHNEALNMGVGEGCAYRGRLLLEINSQDALGEPEPRSELPPSDLDVVKRYRKLQEYRLQIELLDLTMLSDAVRSGEIKVELSIGLNGNISEDGGEACFGKSCTWPEKAVFDGNYYWHMGWTDKKPCLEIVSEWEEIDYRIHALNFLRFLRHYLEKLLAEAEDALERKLLKDVEYAEDFYNKFQDRLRKLTELARTELPEPDVAFTK